MKKNLSGKGGMVREVTEQDIEKGEKSTKLEIIKKDVEKGDCSTKPKEPERHIEKAESSTKPEITVKDDEEYAESPNRLREGEGSMCIFKIPQSLKKIHHKGYEPEVVSIGPYHHGKEHLQMTEEHKDRFLQLFLKKAKDGVDKNFLRSKILQYVTVLKNSYSEKLDGVEQPTLLEMMLLDGCFILTLFLFVARKFDESQNDPILTTPWILGTLRSDLLLLENQVPFILLEILLKELNIPSLGNLKELAFTFFNLSMDGEDKSRNSEAKHLLDLIRKSFIPIPSSNATKTSPSSQCYSRLILSAKRLRLQGIKFKASHDHSSSKVWCKKMVDHLFNESNAFVSRSSQKKTILLEIKLDRNELHIPPIVFDKFISSVLLNCVAFEQLSADCSNDITSYVAFMGCLMNDEADATYLSEKGIIENYFGNGSDVSQFFKNICKDIAFDMRKSYLKEEFEGINKYTSNKWNVECARFKHLHFDSPWTLLSSLAVLVAILLSLIQTTFGVLSYLRPTK